uniref:THD domain-containing protein n=1 Tax=Denticeps clupeoides TaxID=299321 RepID=A0AAY4DIX9_9TELE
MKIRSSGSSLAPGRRVEISTSPSPASQVRAETETPRRPRQVLVQMPWSRRLGLFRQRSVAMASGTKLPGNSPLPWNVLPSSEWSHDMYNKSECAVIIPVSGLYAINLQITYRSTPHLDHPDSFIVLKNEVKKQLVRYQPGRNVTILTAMDTVPNTDVWMKTIHSQITLFLGEGDKLQVVVSHPNLVDLGGQAQTKSFWELAFLYA